MSPQDVMAIFLERGRQPCADVALLQVEHGWQCAQLAARAHAEPALQLAAWLRDLGQLMGGAAAWTALDGLGARHELLAAGVLAPAFGPAVADPVALQVQARRFMLAARPQLLTLLTPACVRQVEERGGPMSAGEAAHFASLPHARDAVRLCQWDDAAKVVSWRPADMGAALRALSALMAWVHALHLEQRVDPSVHRRAADPLPAG